MSTSLNRSSVVTRGLAVLLLTASFVASAGCEAVNRLREAQSAFSEAAALENASRIGADGQDVSALAVPRNPGAPLDDAGSAAADLARARAGYAAALVSLELIDDEQRGILERDNLWGVAESLHAMTLWRLERYDEALTIADAAVTDTALQPRDLALMTAMPGLIRIDLAYAKLNAYRVSGAPEGGFQDVRSRLLEAIDRIAVARKKVAPDHPINVYLIQSQLAAHRNLMIAYQDLVPGEVDASAEERADASHNLNDLKSLIGATSNGQAVVGQWSTWCNVDPVPRPGA